MLSMTTLQSLKLKFNLCMEKNDKLHYGIN
jgi:hypothetical protein